MKITKNISPILFIFICLSQIFYGFIYSDDLFFSYNKELINNTFHFFISLFKSWGIQGRLTPLMFGIIIITTKYLSIFQYKLYLIILNIIAIYSFIKLIKQYIPNFNISLWSTFFFSLFHFQLGYHCSFNSFNGMYPLLLTLISSCIFYKLKFIDTNQKKYNILSFFLYFLSLLIIEIAYITPFLLFLVTYHKTKNIFKSLYLNRSIFITTLLFISVSLYLKSQMHFKMHYIGLQTNFDLFPIIKTYIIQTFSSLPLIYLYKQKLILPNILSQIKIHGVYLFTFLFVISFTLFQTLKTKSVQSKKDLYMPILLGLTLWLFPPIFISISAKYQNELYLGRGYIPLYIQNFGLATVFYCIFSSISNNVLKKGILIIACIIIFINLSYNFHQIEEATNKSYRLLKEINP